MFRKKNTLKVVVAVSGVDPGIDAAMHAERLTKRSFVQRAWGNRVG